MQPQSYKRLSKFALLLIKKISKMFSACSGHKKPIVWLSILQPGIGALNVTVKKTVIDTGKKKQDLVELTTITFLFIAFYNISVI